MSELPTPPEPENRPKMWRYYRDRDMTRDAVGAVFGRTAEWVRLICLPFGDPKRRVPSPDDVLRIRDWSQGEIGPADWYPVAVEAPTASVTAEAST